MKEKRMNILNKNLRLTRNDAINNQADKGLLPPTGPNHKESPGLEGIIMAAPIISKLCPTCKKTKTIDEFYHNKRNKDGHGWQCRECHNAYYKTDIGKAKSEKWRESYKNIKKENYHRTKNEPGQKELRRNRAIKSKYGITESIFKNTLINQKGVCAICGTRPNGKPLVIDHCHETNHVRGLLCAKCNTAIGMLGDTLINIMKVVRYLEVRS